MIPKIIHYCWFGGKPLPALAKMCIKSWQKHFPDYEIKEWNESNFDINTSQYTRDAYNAKKFAFVSDYVRFYVLYRYGGVYFDTDVKVIKNMDWIIKKGSFMGCENPYTPDLPPKDLHVATGLCMGVQPEHPFLAKVLDYYSSKSFVNPTAGNTSTENVVVYITDLLCKEGLIQTPDIQQCAGFYIYPKDYFCPAIVSGKPQLKDNTHSIHYYAASWFPRSKKIKKWFIDHLPVAVTNSIFNMKAALRSLKLIK